MRKFAVLATTLAAATLVTSLSGCATQFTPTYNAVAPRVAADKEKAEKMLAVPQSPSASPTNYSDKSWLPVRKVVHSEREKANAKTDAIQIEINQRFVNLNEVVGVVSSLTGMPVFVSPEVSSAAPGATSPSATTFTPIPASTVGMPSLPPLPGASSAYSPLNNLSSAAPAATITTSSAFAANYSGSLTGFLNQVSAYYGVFWKVDADGLRFFKTESRTFRIAALPGDTRLNSNVDSAASGGGGGGSSSGSSSSLSGSAANSAGVGFSGLSVWNSLEAAIKQMMTPNGRVFSSPATGTITVTDSPNVMATVADFISAQNLALSRQVSVNVRVLSVELNSADDYGINWDAVYKNLTAVGSAYSIGLKTALPMASGGGNLILSAPSSSTSRWAGSSAMIAALSTQGRVSELTSSTLVTLNNQPSPVNVGRSVSYLASSSTAQTPNVGSTTSLIPGTIQTGFSMTLLPHIIDGHEMLLQYSLNLSSLLRLTTITSGTNSIQAPDVSTSNFIQRVRIMSGETLVVAGFDQDNLSAVANGVGSAENPVLGARNGTNKRTLLVVLIQPSISAQ